MNCRRRIRCYLLNVFFIVQIIDPELCTFVKHRFFRLVILLVDFQLCLKFLIEKHSPHLWSVRMIIDDPYDKIIHRFVVVGLGSFPVKV